MTPSLYLSVSTLLFIFYSLFNQCRRHGAPLFIQFNTVLLFNTCLMKHIQWSKLLREYARTWIKYDLHDTFSTCPNPAYRVHIPILIFLFFIPPLLSFNPPFSSYQNLISLFLSKDLSFFPSLSSLLSSVFLSLFLLTISYLLSFLLYFSTFSNSEVSKYIAYK